MINLRLLYTSDLHGNATHYQALVALIHKERPDLLILGGDLAPLHGVTQSSVDMQRQFIQDEFRAYMDATRQEGIADILIIPGNNDWSTSFADMNGIAAFLPDSPWKKNGVTITGYGIVPPTPFRVKDHEKRDLSSDAVPEPDRECCFTENGQVRQTRTRRLYLSRATIEEDLKAIAWDDNQCNILVTHAPPFGTHLDRIRGGTPVGSRAIRRFILQKQPRVSLHGHIHESPKISGAYRDKLGDTISINPGQAERSLSAVIIDFTENHMQLRHTVYYDI